MRQRPTPKHYDAVPVKPGTRTRRQATSEQRRMAKTYGHANGYEGTSGGWIWRDGHHVARGWSEFWYLIGGDAILAWAARTRKEQP